MVIRGILYKTPMKVRSCCYDCLRKLAEKTVSLSGGNSELISACYRTIDECWDKKNTPAFIANKLLASIREVTGVYDPYASIKSQEFVKAKKTKELLRMKLPQSLEEVLKISALGNTVDFFTSIAYDADDFMFFCNMEKVEEEIHNKGNDVLILGDNIGDFLFDIDLIEYLHRRGKRVLYAVKEHPVQNDLSLLDVERFALTKYFHNIISTGTREVGIRKEEMKGIIKELWESNAIVIAKGMGNFETLSEFSHERQIIYIMKIKCPAVADTLQIPLGAYNVTLS